MGFAISLSRVWKVTRAAGERVHKRGIHGLSENEGLYTERWQRETFIGLGPLPHYWELHVQEAGNSGGIHRAFLEVGGVGYNMSGPGAGGMWICPPRAGFTQPIGKNSCFAHALLQMILGVPQMVAFFATQDWPAGGTGALLARCLALLWMSEDDQEGPDGVELLRARVEGDFGQNYHH